MTSLALCSLKWSNPAWLSELGLANAEHYFLVLVTGPSHMVPHSVVTTGPHFQVFPSDHFYMVPCSVVTTGHYFQVLVTDLPYNVPAQWLPQRPILGSFVMNGYYKALFSGPCYGPFPYGPSLSGYHRALYSGPCNWPFPWCPGAAPVARPCPIWVAE